MKWVGSNQRRTSSNLRPTSRIGVVEFVASFVRAATVKFQDGFRSTGLLGRDVHGTHEVLCSGHGPAIDPYRKTNLLDCFFHLLGLPVSGGPRRR